MSLCLKLSLCYWSMDGLDPSGSSIRSFQCWQIPLTMEVQNTIPSMWWFPLFPDLDSQTNHPTEVWIYSSTEDVQMFCDILYYIWLNSELNVFAYIMAQSRSAIKRLFCIRFQHQLILTIYRGKNFRFKTFKVLLKKNHNCVFVSKLFH